MRTPTSGIDTALAAVGSQPGYLVRIVLASETHYLCTLDVASTFGDYIWVPYDVQIIGINWATGAMRNARIVLGEPSDPTSLIWWGYALRLELQDAPIDIWQCYAEAPDEAEPLWHGRIGGVRKVDNAVDCDLCLDTNTLHSPRRRVQQVVPAKFLVQAGKVMMVGGTKWILGKKLNG